MQENATVFCVHPGTKIFRLNTNDQAGAQNHTPNTDLHTYMHILTVTTPWLPMASLYTCSSVTCLRTSCHLQNNILCNCPTGCIQHKTDQEWGHALRHGCENLTIATVWNKIKHFQWLLSWLLHK